jgi:hypothetical protein
MHVDDNGHMYIRYGGPHRSTAAFMTSAQPDSHDTRSAVPILPRLSTRALLCTSRHPRGDWPADTTACQDMEEFLFQLCLGTALLY